MSICFVQDQSVWPSTRFKVSYHQGKDISVRLWLQAVHGYLLRAQEQLLLGFQ